MALVKLIVPVPDTIEELLPALKPPSPATVSVPEPITNTATPMVNLDCAPVSVRLKLLRVKVADDCSKAAKKVLLKLVINESCREMLVTFAVTTCCVKVRPALVIVEVPPPRKFILPAPVKETPVPLVQLPSTKIPIVAANVIAFVRALMFIVVNAYVSLNVIVAPVFKPVFSMMAVS